MIVGSPSAYDEIAGIYHRARPSYPDELVEDVLEFANLPQSARALEIGCGTGQASLSFAARGLRLVCLEPGPTLAQGARERLRSFPHAQVLCTTFEQWPLEREAFDLIFSATAFHWVRREVRFHKTAQALRMGGTLAIFNAVARPQTSSLPDALKNVLKRDGTLRSDRRQWPFETQLRECADFGSAAKREYFTTRSYDAAGLEDLLRSLNRFRRLSIDEQSAVTAMARQAVEARGGLVSLDFRIRLIMARRESKKSWWRRWV
jgi:SAM-dependent methyltransferase